MSKSIHISIDNILIGWKHSCNYNDPDGEILDECSIGRITSWGGHYIAIVHTDVPEDERKKVAEFIANAPSLIGKLKNQTEREGKLILKMKKDISFYKRKVNNLTQKLRSGKNK